MAGKTLVRPENGRLHGIRRNIPNMARKNHIKIFFKVGSKMANKEGPNFFFDPPKNKNPRSKKYRHIGFMETFNI